MGKATIISETGEGLYTIRPEYNNDQINSDISNLTSNISDYESRITTLETEKNDILTEYDNKKDELDVAISDYRANPNEVTLGVMNTITQEIASITARLTNKTRELGREKLKKVSAEKQKTKLENLVSANQTNISAWNIAYIEGLTGEVDTIEINGEPDQILIGESTLDDSKLTEILGQSVAGSLFNFALTPYWQKWNPTFRLGTITDINGDLADVALDSALSHYQNLDINQSTTLSNVPFKYLTCDEEAFEVGNEVVIEFTSQDWSNPTIVGFKEYPRSCVPPSNPLLGGYLTYDRYQTYDVGLPQLFSFPLKPPTIADGWSVVDLSGGSNPDISLDPTLEYNIYAKILNYNTGEIRLDIEPYYSYLDPVWEIPNMITLDTISMHMDLSYSDPNYTIKFKVNNRTGNCDGNYDWLMFVMDPSTGTKLPCSGPAIIDEHSPNVYNVNNNNWLILDSYPEGDIYCYYNARCNQTQMYKGNIQGNSFTLTLNFMCNPKDLVGP